MARLEGKVALVTGGSGGIGRGICRALAKEGAKLAFSFKGNAARAESFREELSKSAPAASSIQADIADPAQVDRLFEAVEKEHGPVEILVNNAGPFVYKLMEKTNLEEWHTVIEGNITGTFLCCRAALPAMRKAQWGRIINLTCTGAGRGLGGLKMTAYMAAKAGVAALTQSLALEVAHEGITVNAVSPGVVEHYDLSFEEARKRPSKEQPVPRPSISADLARAVVFLADPEADFITGTVLDVTGGQLLYDQLHIEW